ncbi:hypothetical protein [Rhizobium sp. BK176]|uniref:hypothetical protein n=1 Tax=Rhizobium sp. BK176 TaxID=2587071 RepID=UPI0021682D44|nr:hypothetical protein [Rhizobium sp. BK176]MCS4089406.1 hypothetical protein [Rhizobium sp. BK176]
MAKPPMILTPVHQETLLAIDSGMKRFESSYPPAVDLVNEGYCEWARGNPDSWTLDLTNFGIRAVYMIEHPDIVEEISLEKVDDTVSRILDRGELLGFAVKYGEDMWMPYDNLSRRMPSGTMSSPEAVLLMFKMHQARIAEECTQALDIGQLRMVG